MTDPRLAPGFDPNLMPFCDGAEAPPVSTEDAQEQRMLEFAALYYAMNEAASAAERSRQAGDSQGLAKAQARLDALTAKRDALDDLCAQAGFVADPVLFTDGRCIDIRFTWPKRPASSSLFAQRFSAMVQL